MRSRAIIISSINFILVWSRFGRRAFCATHSTHPGLDVGKYEQKRDDAVIKSMWRSNGCVSSWCPCLDVCVLSVPDANLHWWIIVVDNHSICIRNCVTLGLHWTFYSLFSDSRRPVSAVGGPRSKILLYIYRLTYKDRDLLQYWPSRASVALRL